MYATKIIIFFVDEDGIQHSREKEQYFLRVYDFEERKKNDYIAFNPNSIVKKKNERN